MAFKKVILMRLGGIKVRWEKASHLSKMVETASVDNIGESPGPLFKMGKNSYFVLNYIWNLSCRLFKMWILVFLTFIIIFELNLGNTSRILSIVLGTK